MEESVRDLVPTEDTSDVKRSSSILRTVVDHISYSTVVVLLVALP